MKPKDKQENLKGQMLRNAKKLRNTNKEQLKKVIITPDMTAKENLVIRRGKIVNGTLNEID